LVRAFEAIFDENLLNRYKGIMNMSIEKNHTNNDPTRILRIWNKLKNGISNTNLIIALATIAIAISTGFYTYYARSQFVIMSNTLSHSQEVFDSAIENFHLEQRAWVGPMRVSSPKYEHEGKNVFVKKGLPLRCGVHIANSGKTPALKLRTRLSVSAINSDAEFHPEYVIDSSDKDSITVLQPGMTLTLNFSSSLEIFSTNIDDFKEERRILYMYGVIDYEDIFGNPHSTKFCMYLAPDLMTFKGADTYNEAD
jgi:hypothetical protein